MGAPTRMALHLSILYTELPDKISLKKKTPWPKEVGKPTSGFMAIYSGAKCAFLCLFHWGRGCFAPWPSTLSGP